VGCNKVEEHPAAEFGIISFVNSNGQMADILSVTPRSYDNVGFIGIWNHEIHVIE